MQALIQEPGFDLLVLDKLVVLFVDLHLIELVLVIVRQFQLYLIAVVLQLLKKVVMMQVLLKTHPVLIVKRLNHLVVC